jgi:hypothetical protein
MIVSVMSTSFRRGAEVAAVELVDPLAVDGDTWP